MRIAVSSDWHGERPDIDAQDIIESCDALLLCGDIFERNTDGVEQYLRGLTAAGKRVIMTPGNHDISTYIPEADDDDDRFYDQFPMRKLRSVKWLWDKLGVECLIDAGTLLGGLTVYGTPWTPEFCNWAFMLPDTPEGLGQKYSLIPDGVDILIAHGPPMVEGCGIDSCHPKLYFQQPDHLGSRMLTEAIVAKKPRWFFCGHIHTGDHRECVVGGTKCLNVSHVNESYLPEFQPFVLEV